jgi:hypothetical protein
MLLQAEQWPAAGGKPLGSRQDFTCGAPFMRQSALLVLGALAALSPVSLAAQARDSTALASVLEQLQRRQLVRIETAAGARFFGRAVQVGSDSLVVTAPPPTEYRHLSVDSVARLWIQNGTHARQYTLYGGIAGAVLLGILGFVYSGIDDSADACTGWCIVPAAAGAGALFGGVLGFGVGALNPRWRLVFPLP